MIEVGITIRLPSLLMPQVIIDGLSTTLCSGRHPGIHSLFWSFCSACSNSSASPGISVVLTMALVLCKSLLAVPCELAYRDSSLPAVWTSKPSKSALSKRLILEADWVPPPYMGSSIPDIALELLKLMSTDPSWMFSSLDAWSRKFWGFSPRCPYPLASHRSFITSMYPFFLPFPLTGALSDVISSCAFLLHSSTSSFIWSVHFTFDFLDILWWMYASRYFHLISSFMPRILDQNLQ